MDTNFIKETIQDICTRLGFSVVDVEISEDTLGTTFSVHLEGGDPLLERGGVGIAALNHVVKRIIFQRVHGADSEEKHPPFSIDINNHQKQKNEALIQKARMYAERARSFGTEVELDPMNAYERMVVHNALSEEADIETESRGFGRDRHIVIKPKK